jgi:hypothetical protein
VIASMASVIAVTARTRSDLLRQPDGSVGAYAVMVLGHLELAFLLGEPAPQVARRRQAPPAPTTRLASASEAAGHALSRRVGDVRRREFLRHRLRGGAALASGSIVDAERIVTAASVRVDARLLDVLHTVAAGYAERMHTTAPRELLPQVQRHRADLDALLRREQPSAQAGRLHLSRWDDAPAAAHLDEQLHGVTWVPL